jgi:hypothetical protein
MKKLFFTLLFFGFTISMTAQDTPKVGDVLVINEPYAQTFNHVKFPKLNTLTKRGKVANYKSVYGDHVVISEVMTEDDGTTYVILKQKDGSKFFGIKTAVKANYTKAIEAKELSVIK